MLHLKFHGNRSNGSSGSGEDFVGFLQYMA